MGLAALLLPFVPGLIQNVELAYKSLPKSGPFKMQTVIRMLGQVAEGMMNAKAPLPDGSQIVDKSVPDDLLKGLVEAEFARLKATGKLDGSQAGPGAGLYVVDIRAIVPIGIPASSL